MNNIFDAQTEHFNIDAMDTDRIRDEEGDVDEEINSRMERIKVLLDKMNKDRFTDIADLHLSCADEYHNEGVDAARERDFQHACDVVVKGEEEFPGNIDLIADCIHYSSLCSRDDIAGEYYKKLRQLPWKCYNWRAFSFAIEFLLKDFKKNEAEIREIIEKYKKYIPYDERAFESESELEEKLGNTEKVIDILTEAINRFPNASQCALRLLEYQFDRGLYDEALITARYGLSCIETQPSVNLPFFALCEALLLDHQLHIQRINGEEITKTEINSLAEKYGILAKDFKNDLHHYQSVIKVRRNLLTFINSGEACEDNDSTVKIPENVGNSN